MQLRGYIPEWSSLAVPHLLHFRPFTPAFQPGLAHVPNTRAFTRAEYTCLHMCLANVYHTCLSHVLFTRAFYTCLANVPFNSILETSIHFLNTWVWLTITESVLEDHRALRHRKILNILMMFHENTLRRHPRPTRSP